MRNKLIYITETLKEFHLDFFCLTETWLFQTDIGVVLAALPKCYSVFNIPRPHGRGGGVALIYSLSISCIRQVPNQVQVTSFEYLEVCFTWMRRAFRAVIVYRPGHPGTDLDFMREFASLLEVVLSLEGELLIFGDFNYWIDDPGQKPYTPEFLELLDLNNINNYVSDPTHIHGHILNLVQAYRTSNVINHVEVIPIDITISDHALVLCELKVTNPPSYKKSITFRNYRSICYADVDEEIQQHLVASPLLNSEALVSNYNNFFLTLRDRYCPLIDKSIVVREDGPWYNREIAAARRRRRQSERKWRRLKTESSRLEYIQARGAVSEQVLQNKIDFFKNKLDACGGDQKKIYNLLDTLLGHRSVSVLPDSTSNTELANRFSNYFTTKIAQIRDLIAATPVAESFSVDFNVRFPSNLVFTHFEPVQENTVSRYIREVNMTYCSLDPINVSKLDLSFEKAAPYIMSIINSCFSEAHFVASEKRALIRPGLKKAGLDKEVLSNYRPISNLSLLSKYIERAMLDQLVPFLEQVEAISKYQSAYRKFHSTDTALCKIHDDLVQNACMGKVSILVFLDLSAAFDTVDHQILLSDFNNYCIEGPAFRLLESYLLNRTQSVIIGESVSEPQPLSCGVPQGSVLGPILFLIYMSTIVFLLDAHGVSYHFYADDSQLYICIDDTEYAKIKVVQLLKDIRRWMCERKLKLNDRKTEIMLVRGNLRGDEAEEFGNLDLGDFQLTPVPHAKNLGVLFDSALNFKNHVNSLVRSCNFHIRNLYAVRRFMQKENIMSLVHSLILSKVDYCNSLFIGLPNVTLKKIQSVMNRAARLITQLPPRVSITPTLIDLHWLPVRARIEYKICLITFKALKFHQPKYICDLLTPLAREHDIVLRSTGDPFHLWEPRAPRERNFANRSFSYVAPRMYNRLPVAIKQLESLDCFKKHLKTHFFNLSYDFTNHTVSEMYKV